MTGAPKKKRIITVEENGQVLYKGEDKRFYNQDYMRCALGIPIIDWIKVGIYVIGVVVVLVRYDVRLTASERTQEKTTEIVERLVQYTENSDGYHSAATGQLFANGKPTDNAITDSIRKKIGYPRQRGS